MKEYRIIKIEKTSDRTEALLNRLAKEGFKVVCAYSVDNRWLILERDKIW